MLVKFLVITEENEWEGETWSFFFKDTPINKKSFEFAKKLLKNKSCYSFKEQELYESQIESMKECKDTTYLNRYNFLTGEFDFEAGFKKLDKEDQKEPFYKGQYERFKIK